MNSTALRPTRGPSRGGIQKRPGARVRVDRDGDLDMDAPAGGTRGGRGGGSGRGRGVFTRGGGLGSGPPRGPASDRPRGAGGSGAMRGNPRRDPVGTRPRNAVYQPPPGRGRLGEPSMNEGPTVEARVEGWKESRGSAEECINFLERKSRLKFKKTQKQGDCLIIFLPLSKVNSLLEWDNALFASSHLRITAPNLNAIASTIETRSNAIISQAATKSRDTVDTIKTLEQVLANRYNVDAKFLDLSKLGEDPLLKQNGFFELSSTTSKMFPALMQIADKRFVSAQQKRDTVHSVSLAYNSLKDIRAVTSLSVTFPDLKNLSLQGNMIESWQALDTWKNRFRGLEQLVLIGNPLTRHPDYKLEAMRRYPALTMLDNVVLDRTLIKIGDDSRMNGGLGVDGMSGAVDAKGKPVFPLKTQGKFIQDDHTVAMQFLSTFFATYDADKPTVLSQFYDSASSFSLSVNTSAPRVEAQQSTRQFWDPYIPRSRNLTRVTHQNAVINRLFVGPEAIGRLWNELPPVRHNLANEELWSFDVWPIEVVGVNGIMVGGIMCCVHGEFDESNGDHILKRSFDRTFILRPDANGAVKVGNDVLVLRAYGGFDSWKQEETPVPAVAPTPMIAAAGMNVGQGMETEEQQQMAKCYEFAKKSGLKMEWAQLCLTETDWDLAQGWEAFVKANAMGNIPPDAFDPNITRPV